MSACRFCSTVPDWVEMLRSDAPMKPENRAALADWFVVEQANHEALHETLGFIDALGRCVIPKSSPLYHEHGAYDPPLPSFRGCFG